MEKGLKLNSTSEELASSEQLILQRALEREKRAKIAAEKIIEKKSTELYYKNKELEELNTSLENLVAERTSQLREALNQAEQLAQTKENFLANMSHEIRTPMNSIVGFTDLLLKSQWPENEFTYLNAIKSSSNNLLVIINDILDLSKINSGKLQLEQTDFSIKEIINNTQYAFKNKVEEKGIELFSNLDKSLDENYVGDPVRLQQILTNIVSNAVKFTEKGSVTITTKVVKTTSSRSTLQFQIIDTGVGIDPDKIQTVFESFKQEDDSITRKFGGTGLGLAICKQLVHLFDGNIEVESKKNIGTTFIVTIPLVRVKQTQESFENKQPKPKVDLTNKNKGAKILVAEDNTFNQLLIKNVLKNNDYEADVVENGNLVLQKLKENSYDAILMDIQMPEMSGVEATKIIREQLKNNEIPIIALTANALKDDRLKYISCGMDDYLSKPFDEKDIVKKLNKHIKKGHQSIDYNLDSLIALAREDVGFLKEVLPQLVSSLKEGEESLAMNLEGRAIHKTLLTIHKIKSSISLIKVDVISDLIEEIEAIDLDYIDFINFENKINLLREKINVLINSIKTDLDDVESLVMNVL